MYLEFSKSWQQLICRYAAYFGQSSRIQDNQNGYQFNKG